MDKNVNLPARADFQRSVDDSWDLVQLAHIRLTHDGVGAACFVRLLPLSRPFRSCLVWRRFLRIRIDRPRR
jgi:hypothetical protein